MSKLEELRTQGSLRSDKWEALEKAFKKKNPRCAVCGTQSKLQVHHKFPFHLGVKGKKLELNIKNLITLCQPHHFTFGHLASWASYNASIEKDAKAWNKKIRGRP